ncbi:uncharacterized protein LOC130992376 [Salvia miltiorrhiza]|uniref:uncharacterized protein LOC130992376 n=1 Tax=Salvia miltiorrhiza TaxID=226208 RepID=UPI0025ABF86D|nr:uncharacterized protein LOC130992376 [Salvia miltiorrhiza]
MRGYHLNFSPSHFLLLVFLVLCLSVQTRGEDSCVNAFCGQGRCVPSGAEYSCTCNNGWKNDILGIDLRACVIPNCTINLGCGNSAPPPPPPPPPPPGLSLPPFLDPLSPCFLVYCGEGTCLANGTKHTCECDAGTANLLGFPDYPCFNKCSMDLDCRGILLSATAPPPPNGSDKISKRWSNVVVSLSTIILAWIIYE